VVALSLLCGSAAWAGQVVRDGTVGPGGALPGPAFVIPDTDGQTRGGNLFHSFSQFSLSEGESATFTGAESIQNVIARVTGGQASLIDGALNCDIPGANFFFINPFGVLFGEHTQINVQGSFAATTADYVKLADGGRFDARNPANDILTTAPVSAFGFLGPTAAPITLESRPVDFDDPPFLTFLPDGKSFWLVGGDIVHDGYFIIAFGGQFTYVSVASAGELGVDLDNSRFVVDTSPFAALGDVTLSGHASLYVNGEPGGFVNMEGNWIRFLEGGFNASNEGSGTSGGVILNARAGIEIIGGGLNGTTYGDGDAGDILLTAPIIRLHESAVIGAGTGGSGNAGNVLITAGEFTISGGGGVTTFTGAGGGAGGDLVVKADYVRIEGDPASPAVSSLNSATSGGVGGNIRIEADTVEIRPAGQIITDSQGGEFVGGDIYITANTLIMDDQNRSEFTRISSRSIEGGAGGGNIFLDVGRIDLRNGAQITTSTENAGPAGNIHIQAGDVLVTGGAAIASASTAEGGAGTVEVNLAGNLRMEDSLISVASAQSTGGDIRITAGREIRLVNSQLTAQALGDGGNVVLQAPQLIYAQDSTISAESSEGNGGNLTLDPVFVVLNNATLLAKAIVGNGGNITIVSDYFLASDSVIDASSQFGLQGTVLITAPETELAGELVDLEGELLDAEALLRPHCAVRLPAGVSSFRLSPRPPRLTPPTGLLPGEGLR
jgi:filamentous hemagglutinin family protein